MFGARMRKNIENFAKMFAKVPQKLSFAHFPDAVASSGRQELHAVKIPASYDAWRTPTSKKRNNKIDFLTIFFGVVSAVREAQLAVCAKGLIEPELAEWLGNCETEVDYFFFKPFHLFVTFFPFLLRIAILIAKGRSKGGRPGRAGATHDPLAK